VTKKIGPPGTLLPAHPDLTAAGQAEVGRSAEGRKMQVCVGVADLRRAPFPDAPLETQALFGEKVTLFNEHEGFGRVRLASDGYVGHIAMAALADEWATPTHRVAVARTFVYPGPDLKLPPRDALPLGATVRIQANQGAFAQIGDAAFAFADHLAAIDAVEPDFVAAAELFLHVPYLWGGKTSLGIDCSGLVQVSLNAAGVRAPRDSCPQRQELGTAIECADCKGLRRGDLVFWPGHVGIMRDEATLLHANAHHMLVASEPLCVARERILASTSRDIAAIKRLG
jgi:cell wall-associated NlpC family hydrolase